MKHEYCIHVRGIYILPEPLNSKVVVKRAKESGIVRIVNNVLYIPSDVSVGIFILYDKVVDCSAKRFESKAFSTY